MSDKEVMHRYIEAREKAKQYKGTKLGKHWAATAKRVFRELSLCAQIQVRLGAPDENVG